MLKRIKRQIPSPLALPLLALKGSSVDALSWVQGQGVLFEQKIGSPYAYFCDVITAELGRAIDDVFDVFAGRK